MASSSRYDSRKLLPERQRHLGAALDIGFPVFMEELRKIVKEEAAKVDAGTSWKNAWRRMNMLGNVSDIAGFYLSSIHWKVLRGYITGELTSLAAGDEGLQYALQQYATLGTEPSVYINVVCRRKMTVHKTEEEFLADEDRSRWDGYSVSIDQLRSVCDVMSIYTDANPGDDELCDKVDKAISEIFNNRGNVSENILHRCFLPNDTAVHNIQSWVRQVRRMVISEAEVSMAREELGEPLPWCFQECEFARNGVQGASRHIWQGSSTYLMGLFYSTLEHLYPKQFELRFYMFQMVGEAEDASLVEFLGHLVTGSFAARPYVGLNPALPGALPITGTRSLLSSTLAPGFLRSQKMIGDSDVWETNKIAEKKKREDFEAGVKAMGRIDEAKGDSIKVRSRLVMKRAEWDEEVKNWDQEVAELDKALEALEDS